MTDNAMTRDRAELIAARALEFVAASQERLDRFVGLTGLALEEIRANLAEPAFLAGILEYLMGEEHLLLEFAGFAGIAPEAPGEARVVLAGGPS